MNVFIRLLVYTVHRILQIDGLQLPTGLSMLEGLITEGIQVNGSQLSL